MRKGEKFELASLTVVAFLAAIFFSDVKADQIIVNKSDQMLYYVDDNDHVLMKSRVVIGRDSRPTPTFTDTLTHVVVNPYWNIPASLLESDVLPNIRKYKGYMEYQGFEVLDQVGDIVTDLFYENNFVMEPGWRMRQRPGPRNVLGDIKFMLQDGMNKGPAIFLHGTNRPELYDQPERRYSSGCIRVENWNKLAFLLGITNQQKGKEKWIKVDPVTVTIVGE